MPKRTNKKIRKNHKKKNNNNNNSNSFLGISSKIYLKNAIKK
jgi:hypothetical protein